MREGIYYQKYHQASKKPEVGEGICNTYKEEWAHIQNVSGITKA